MHDNIELTEEKYDWVTDLKEHERDALANMLMRSLRGSWNNPQGRIQILEMCAEEGLSDYDAERVLSKIHWFKEQYFDGWHDGRIFRSVYEAGPDVSEQTSREFVERYASKLPHDMTWRMGRIDSEYGGNEDA